VDGARPRDRPMKTWRRVVEKDCKNRQVNKDALLLWTVVNGGNYLKIFYSYYLFFSYSPFMALNGL